MSTTMIYTHVLNRGGRGVQSPLAIAAKMEGAMPLLEHRTLPPALPGRRSGEDVGEQPSGQLAFTPRVPRRYLDPANAVRLGSETDDSIPQSGDTGYHSCPDARDLVVFLRENSGRTSVHLFVCRREPRFVVLADSWVRNEPSTTSDLISGEFAAERQSRAVVLKHRCRLALE